jgi:branched-chain amino acid transport system permease protein
LMRDVSSDALIIIPCAMLAGALFAFVTGALALRTRGVAFIMITLAFGQMLYFVAQSLSIYGGDDGLTIYARMSIAGWRPLKAETAFYALALASLIIAYLVARFVTRSPLGRAAAAARDNPERMAAHGYNVTKLRLALYALSGVFAGLAGVLRQSGRVCLARLSQLATLGRTHCHGGHWRHGNADRPGDWSAGAIWC